MTDQRTEEAAGPTARTVAAYVLVRVWKDAAFASAVLDAELGRTGIDARDAALATELVYGVLRTERFLDETIESYASKPGQPIAPEARAHLLIGAYSLCFLDRVPAFAAVSQAVTGVRQADAHVAGFANAVLRRLAATIEEKGRPALGTTTLASAPGWLRGSLRRTLGRKGAAAYLDAGPIPPPIGLCLAAGEDRAAWIETLQKAMPGATIEEGRASPRAILVRAAGDVRKLPGFEQAWIVQEEGAQVVALAVGARPGERVLDACAGRGNKAFLLRDAVTATGAVDAADLYPAKLERLNEGTRTGWVRATHVVDWTIGTGTVPDDYDRVLVDAPCSGTGTLRRRPEILGRRGPDEIARLSELQIAITRGAATRVKDGGRLVFAVCSVLREEAEDVVAALLSGPIELGGKRVTLEAAPFDAKIAGEGATLRLLPHVQGTDGYFVASFVVRRG